MPTAALAYSDPFGSGPRPYLALDVTGINSNHGPIVGLIDSGADTTLLPVGYAPLMGYGQGSLRPTTIGTAGAPAQGFQATQPCTAEVIGIPGVAITLLPVFLASNTPLWGRRDFMLAFRVLVDEAGQKFELSW